MIFICDVYPDFQIFEKLFNSLYFLVSRTYYESFKLTSYYKFYELDGVRF